MDLYSQQKETFALGELAAIAETALRTKALSPTADFSPAEAFAGLAKSIAEYRKTGALPQNVNIRFRIPAAARKPS